MAWPAMLSLMLTNIVDIVDIALVGRLGRQEIAAYGYAAQYLHLVNMVIQSVGIGCVALMARALGARDETRAREVLAGSAAVAFTLAMAAVVVVLAVPSALLVLLKADAAVVTIAVPYFRLVIASTLFFSISFLFESALRAHKMTRAPLVITLLVVLSKTALSFGFVLGFFGFPRLGLIGAGLSTLLAHAFGLALYMVTGCLARRQGVVATFGPGHVLAARRVVREVIRVALPAVFERFVMSLALLTYFAILSGYGTAAIAAYAIGVRLLSFSWVPGLGFATAASTFIGQALGANDSAGAKDIGVRAVRLAVAVMTVLGVVCFFSKGLLARLFTQDTEVIEHLLPFMTMLAFAQPFMGAHFTLGGVLRGAGDTMTPLIAAGLGNWVFRVPLAWIYAHLLGWSLAWVWSALILDHFVRMLFNGRSFLRGRWASRTGGALSVRAH